LKPQASKKYAAKDESNHTLWPTLFSLARKKPSSQVWTILSKESFMGKNVIYSKK
jgi:hypothetical protein